MNWNQRWAARTATLRRSAVRELLKLTACPDLISFAGGLPAAELFPVTEVEAAVGEVLRRHTTAALQYGETEGVGELRDWIAARYSTPGRGLTRENVVITSGAQQGLDLIGRILFDPGDRVAVENPTYLALLSAWRPLGVVFEELRIGGEPDAAGCAPRADGLAGAKAAYVVPNFQNPTGRTLTRREREALLVELRAADGVCVEDDPYGELRYTGEQMPSLFELEGASGAGEWRVIRTGTFSKTLAPGFRVGWVLGPPEVIERLVRAKQAVDLHTGTFAQHVVLELLSRGFPDPHLARLRAAYRDRRDAMLSAMETHLPEAVTWSRPAGGMFLFVTLPADADAAALLAEAVARGVAFVPGAEFHLDGGGRNTLRLNFTNATPARIREGIARLGVVLRGMSGVCGQREDGRRTAVV